MVKDGAVRARHDLKSPTCKKIYGNCTGRPDTVQVECWRVLGGVLECALPRFYYRNEGPPLAVPGSSSGSGGGGARPRRMSG